VNAICVKTAPTWVGKTLAVLSVAFAWVLPWSPILAIAALKTTTQLPRWHKLAVVGAILSAAISIAVGALILTGLIRICGCCINCWRPPEADRDDRCRGRVMGGFLDVEGK
jgi:hypothetical protein